jgi:hypothetical protein
MGGHPRLKTIGCCPGSEFLYRLSPKKRTRLRREHPLQREAREKNNSTNNWHNRTIHCLVLCKTNSTSASVK